MYHSRFVIEMTTPAVVRWSFFKFTFEQFQDKNKLPLVQKSTLTHYETKKLHGMPFFSLLFVQMLPEPKLK